MGTAKKEGGMKMKRIIALLVTVVLLAVGASALADGRKFVTINEWLDAKGECGDCALVVQVREVLGPVLAFVEDETGSVNLFTGAEEDLLFNFADHNDAEYYRHWIFVISNPEYNVFEGTVELKNWTLERFMPCITN
jgi:hypothetical protein